MKRHQSHLYKASNDHLYSEIATEGAILNIQSGIYYGLNKTGNQVWQWLQTPKSFDQLLTLLTDGYDVTLSEAAKDLESLLMEMLENNLIEIVNEVAQVF